MIKGQFLENSASGRASEMVNLGKSYAEAAKIVGIDWVNVKTACDRRGIQQSAAAAMRAERNARSHSVTRSKDDLKYLTQSALEMQAGGLTYSEIAAELDLTRCQVAGLIHRAKNRVR